jgi:hypothetical protein
MRRVSELFAVLGVVVKVLPDPRLRA